VPHTVEVAGVQQCDALIQRGLDGGDAFGLVSGATHSGHSHAPKSQRKSAWTGGAQTPARAIIFASHASTIGLV
jgi:hypothetical protein